MISLEKKILNHLLDSYENSKLSRGENKVAIHISYEFTKKNVPEYFDESSLAYEEIHAMLRQMETKGFWVIVWKKNKVGHIVEKVILCDIAISDIYQYLHRVPKAEKEFAVLELFEKMKSKELAPVTRAFLNHMSEQIKAGKSVKEYLDIGNLKDTEELIYALDLTLRNEEEYFVREFSIRHFHDSKRYEMLTAKICKIIREEVLEYEDFENEELLSEYQIYHTPSYVYLKGCVNLYNAQQTIELAGFKEGLGFALNRGTMNHIGFRASQGHSIQYVYTIENLTTFFRFQKENSLIIYLGGYHNHVRRELLAKVYETFPNATYLHFGDIDAGGFQIYYHLCEKTQIRFQTYQMDLETLKKYEKYGKKLTGNDIKRLKKLQCTKMGKEECECVDYMLKHNVKLEQECVDLVQAKSLI